MSGLRDLIEPHIAPGETIKDGRQDETSAIVVTDRRILQVEHGTGKQSRREVSRVDSTLFVGDHVTGATVREVGEEPIDWMQIGVGVLFALIGIGIGSVLGGQGDLAGAFGVVVSVLALLAGVLLVMFAFSTEDGHVVVSLRNDDGETYEKITLAENEAPVARAISEAVGAAHPS